MKKSFLVFGALAALFATNGYAVQSQTVVVTYTCPDGCTLETVIGENGHTHAECHCGGYSLDPQISIKTPSPSHDEIQQVMSESILNQTAMKNAKQNKEISARAATVSPKVVKKIVYEEIVSDDYAE